MSQRNDSAIVSRMAEEKDVKTRRLARDIQQLIDLSAGLWRDRFYLRGLGQAPDRSWQVQAEIVVPTLLNNNGKTAEPACECVVGPHRLVLGIPRFFPLAMPSVFLLPPIPWNAHVMHPDGLPGQVESLPAELQRYVRMGSGHVCYMNDSEWSGVEPDFCNLANVVWVISRILTLELVHPEEAALNPRARDVFIRMKEDGRVPLGAALPCPLVAVQPTEEAVEWNILACKEEA